MAIADVVGEIACGALSAVYVIAVELRAVGTVGDHRGAANAGSIVGSEESRITD